MKKQSFFNSLSPDNRYLVLSVFSIYLVQGIYIIMIGSALPMIKAEYQIDYQVGGMLLSVQSIGYLVMGVVTGILPKYLGMKRTILILTNFAFVGLAIMMVTGNPVLLLFAMLMTGISKGATTNFNNQIVTTLSGGDITHAVPDNTGYITEGQLFLRRDSDIGKVIVDPFRSLSRLKQLVTGKKTRKDHPQVMNAAVRLYADAANAKTKHRKLHETLAD